MKILIEGSPLFARPKTGVGEYTERITELLAKQNPADNFYVAWVGSAKNPRPPLSGHNLHYRPARYFPAKAYNLLQRHNMAPPLDLLSSTRGDAAIFFNFFRHRLLFTPKSIVVVHDLAFAQTADFIKSRSFANSLDRAVKRAVAKSTRLVAVSANTKRDLISSYGANAQKITVINPALDHQTYRPSPPAQIAKTLRKYKINRPYLLFLGTLEPRKNIVGIIEAYKLLPPAIQTKYQLVLAGSPGWKYDQVKSVAKDVPAGRIIFTGYIDDHDKAPLYSGAGLFLFPSHYEGWGMPVLEAMACGTPVLTARNSSLPEAGGQAAYYVNDSRDFASISQGIQAIINDTGTSNRLARTGLIWSRQFTWDKSAARFNKLIREVIK